MTNGLRLRSYLLAAAASLGLGAITPASAITIPEPNPSDFAIVETVSGGIGTFTIYNMSSDWYIYAFSVVNIIGSNPATSRTDWSAGDCTDTQCAPEVTSGTGFLYNNMDSAANHTTDIGPGTHSNQFTFTDPPGGVAYFFVANVDGLPALDSPLIPTGSAPGTPEPSTWAMLIAGFAFLGWRHAVQRGGLKRLLGAA